MTAVASAAEIRRNLEAALAGAAKALALEVTAELTRACPVDTGHARRNFVPSIGSPAEDVADGGAAQQAGMITLASYQIGDGDLYVTNNVPYIDRLILGSSTQAPPGWDLASVDAAIQTVQQQWGVRLDVTSGADVSARNAQAAAGMAAAFSPLGGDE